MKIEIEAETEAETEAPREIIQKVDIRQGHHHPHQIAHRHQVLRPHHFLPTRRLLVEHLVKNLRDKHQPGRTLFIIFTKIYLNIWILYFSII